MASKVDYGMVREVTVKRGERLDEPFVLLIRPFDGDALTLPASHEAMRKLWVHLTKALFPAGSNITRKIGTVMREKETIARDLTYETAAYEKTDEPGTILITGFSRETVWSLSLPKDDAENLWSNLEDYLNEV
jgi:hypothetical protein